MSALVPRGQQAMSLPAEAGWCFTSDVPAEIRLMIYEAAFYPVEPIYIETHKENDQNGLLWAQYTYSKMAHRVMKFLLTSRQIYLEVIPFLYHQSFLFCPNYLHRKCSLKLAVLWMIRIGEHVQYLTHVKILFNYTTLRGTDWLPLLKVVWAHPNIQVEFDTDVLFHDFIFVSDGGHMPIRSRINNIFTALAQKSHRVSKYGVMFKSIHIDFVSKSSHVQWKTTNERDSYTQRLSINSMGMVTLGEMNISSQLKDWNFPMNVTQKIIGHVLQPGRAFEANADIRRRSTGPRSSQMNLGLYYSNYRLSLITQRIFYRQAFDFTLTTDGLTAINYAPFTEWWVKFHKVSERYRVEEITSRRLTLRVNFDLSGSIMADRVHINITPLLECTRSIVNEQKHGRQKVLYAFTMCFDMMTLPKTHPEYTEELVNVSVQTLGFYNDVYEKLKIYTKRARGEGNRPCPDIFIDKHGSIMDIQKHVAVGSVDGSGDRCPFKELKTHLSSWIRKLRKRRDE